MNNKELAHWLFVHHQKHVLGSLTRKLWDDLSEEEKLGWYKFAKETADNYLELFVYGGI